MISFYGALNKFYAYHKSGEMKAPKCKTCGEEHWGLCHDHDARGAIADQRPKSTAARKDVPARGSAEVTTAGPESVGKEANRRRTKAGTQAPPVDTPKRPGRPKTITDMKAYKADKARKRRARMKAK